MKGRTVLAAGTFLLAPLAVGFLASLATADSVSTWYQTLEKPPFTPPDAVFGPVWTVLYIMMGTAAFLFWKATRDGVDGTGGRRGLGLFGAQLLANGLWSILFFGLRRPGIAFAEILVLLFLIVLTALEFRRHSRAAALLLIPYILWVCFAAALNFSIWRLNG